MKTNEFIKLSETFLVNLSSIYSVQLVVVDNGAEVEKYQNTYFNVFNDMYETYCNEHNINIDTEQYSDDELSQEDLDTINQNVFNIIGECPDAMIEQYVVTLTTGQQVVIDEEIFNALKKFAEKEPSYI